MKNFTLGRYIPSNSLIHSLDPRNKIISMLVFLIGIIGIDSGFIGYGVIGIVVLLILFLAKLKPTFILKSLRHMIFMLFFLLVINIFIRKDGDLLFKLGFFEVYSGGLIQTLYIIIRLILMIIVTTILTATTKPLDLTLGLEDLFSPLKRFGFPAHEIAMIISIALRFIPDLMEEAEKIMKAQSSRGVDFAEGKLMEKVKAIVSLLVPLFATSFQRAEDLANAMESRGYNPSSKRTRYRQLKWKFKDTLSLGFIVCLTIGLGIYAYAL